MEQTAYPCLPPDVTEDLVVNIITKTTGSGTVHEKITVKQTLRNLKSKCHKGELIDGSRRPIKFVRLVGCWGNPPADYLEMLDKQQKEIEEMKRQYTVIEMTCSPGGAPPQSIV